MKQEKCNFNPLDLFEKNVIENIENTSDIFEHISYFKLKEIIRFLYGESNEEIDINKILEYFYYDRDLRLELIKQCEVIEISLKKKIVFLMNEKYGELGYLNFLLWVDKKDDSNETLKMQEQFKNKLDKRISKLNSRILNTTNTIFENKEYKENIYSIWNIIDILTFGETIFLFRQMNKTNKIKIANQYNLKAHILINHLENASLIRNLSAHNRLLINMNFRTSPKQINPFKKHIFPNNKKIIISIFIITNLVKLVDKEYNFRNLKKILNKLIRNDEDAQKYGAIDKKSIFEYIDK